MMLPKPKIVKLKGKEKEELRNAIFKRDGYRCVICKRPCTDWHHAKRGCNRSDELSCSVSLCRQCHQDLHSHPKLGTIYNKLVNDYLEELYGKS